METTTKPMTAREKIRKLVEVKEQVQREARENYRNSPDIQAAVEELKKKNAQRRPRK
ncbi:hypothetical protein [Spirosoma sp. KCTC 42546]|uniref:hypothetical protein n=1 Tax=Spirosoma sp. KCTC 42546 TaxID=2520506 RepID=UPI00143DD418|nr:hypothetical protein [Spirosoma sp. KCTC 42546]